MMIDLIRQLDMQAIRQHYSHRERVHSDLRRLFDENAVHDYVQLALGITDGAGNYSESEHGLGPRILMHSSPQDIFECATALEACPNTNHLPEVIYQQGLSYLKISVGTEMATMLKPNMHWIGNVRTIWADLLLKHNGNVALANQEFALYRDGERESEMDYQVWRDVYLALEPSMLRLNYVTAEPAEVQGVLPGQFPYLWADAIASALYDQFADARSHR